jgi:two-component system NarL family response regulator
MRILVASNQQLIGRSLVTLLQHLPAEEPFEAEMSANQDLAASAQARDVDLVLIEALGDFAAGMRLAQQLKSAMAEMPLVLLGSSDDEATLYDAVVAGADGYVTPNTSDRVLTQTLLGVRRGELGVSRSAARTLVRHLCQAALDRQTRAPSPINDHLTHREQEIFALVRQGLRSHDIALRLNIADATVYKHMQKILDKLNVSSRTQALLVANGETPIRVD